MKLKKYKRVKMPLNFRMQNFLLFGDRIFWTSATKTILQKIKRLIKKDDSEFCNTSDGYKLPFHGQNIFSRRGVLAKLNQKSYTTYFQGKRGATSSLVNLPSFSSIRSLSDQYLQGIAIDEMLNAVAYVFSKPGRLQIELFIRDTETMHKFNFDEYKKWYWSEWEAEGLQVYDGVLHVGVNVKTIFGFHLNYIYKSL